MQGMAAALGFQQQREAGVLGDLDGADGIHQHGDRARHRVLRNATASSMRGQWMFAECGVRRQARIARNSASVAARRCSRFVLDVARRRR